MPHPLRSTLTLLLAASPFLISCNKEPPPAPPAEPVRLPAKDAPLAPGCEPDTPAGRACYVGKLSVDYPHLIDGVGSARLLRERLARARVSKIRMHRLNTPKGESEWKIDFHVDAQGRMTEERNEGSGQRTVIAYEGDSRVRSTRYYDKAGAEFNSLDFHGNPDTCLITRRVEGKQQQTRCWVERDKLYFENRFERIEGTLRGNEMRFNSGRFSVRDEQGRVIQQKVSIQTHRFEYEPRRTRQLHVGEGRDGQPDEEWLLNRHGLPVTWLQHRWKPPLTIELTYEYRAP